MTEPTTSAFPAALDSSTTLFGDAANLKQFTLPSTVGSGATTIPAGASLAAVNVPCYLLLGSEIVYATNKSGTDFTSCDRGAGGTTAAEHLSGTVIYVVYAANYHNQVKRALIAIETELGTDPAGTVADLKTRLARSLDGSGNLDFAASTELTIATGSVTPTQNWHTIDTEGDAASDDLDTVVAMTDGFILFIHPNNDTRTVVVKNDTGNILSLSGADITLDDAKDLALLIYDATLSKWIAAPLTPAAAGDMTKAVYDPANIAEQLVGLVAAQTLTNKTLTQPVLTLKQSATPTPTAEGVIEWDTDDNKIKIGDGAGTKVFSDDSVQVLKADVDDTAVDGATTDPISSNWAFDHAALEAGAHGATATPAADKIPVSDTGGKLDGWVSAASEAVTGKVELATIAEVNTGTDATRAVSPDSLAGSNLGIRYYQEICFDFATAVATGDGKGYIIIPAGLNGMNLVSVHAKVITAGTTGTTDIQIANVTDTVDMLSTKITIDSGETGSDTAATPAVINTSTDDVATNDLLRIDVDAISTTPPQGLIVTLGFALP